MNTLLQNGVRHHPLYGAWVGMKRRCAGDPHVKDSDRYVARGITVCERWQKFENFVEDMEPTYRKGLSLDRRDNDKGYSPSNCRWATAREQANNTSRNRRITIGDVTKTLAEWIRTTNLKSSTVRQRIYVYGWSIESALQFQPLRKRG